MSYIVSDDDRQRDAAQVAEHRLREDPFYLTAFPRKVGEHVLITVSLDGLPDLEDAQVFRVYAA